MDPSDFRNNVDGIAFASDAVHCVTVLIKQLLFACTW
jgi:hypothetical protein